jgi:outer membrane receptor for ferrienterochelin and colicins
LFSNQLKIVLIICALGTALVSRAQVVIYGFNGFDGKPLPITVEVNDKTYTSSEEKPGLVRLSFTGYQEVLISALGYEDYRKRINGDVQGKHNIALIPVENSLGPVVVTDVFKNRNRNNTVLNVTTIEAEEIEQLGAFDLRDALSFQSGLRMSRDNALGSSGLSINGIGGDNVKFLIDGVPVIGRFFNQLDLEQFNLDNIQQIEVVEGPMSVIYGSNALAGSINLVTRTPDKASKFSVNSNYESDGQYNLSLTGSKNVNNHSITLTGGRMLFDGWKADPHTREFTWIPKEQYTLRGQYQYKKEDVSVVLRSEGLRAFLLDRGAPIVPYEESAIDQKFYNNRWDNSLTYTNKIGGHTLDMMISNNTFHRVKNKYFKDLVTLEERLVPEIAEQDTQTFNASVFRSILALDKEKTRGFETLLGIDANYEFGRGQRIKNDLQNLLDVALFLSAEKRLSSRVLLRGGLRYAYNSNFSSPLLYSLQSRINMRNSQVIKIAYGKGFRAPSLKELYLDFVDSNHEVFGNADLLPETSHSITASYSKYFRLGKFEFNSILEGFTTI